MAIRTISKRVIQFAGCSFKGMDPVADFSTASTIRGYSSLSCNSFKLNSVTSRYIDTRTQVSSNAMNVISYSRYMDTRHISQLVPANGKRVFLVDTLALVRRLESQGVPTKQAEAITAAITEVLNDTLENLSHSFISKAEMQKIEMSQESSLSKFKSEVQSSQEHHIGMLQRESERLKGEMEKQCIELRYDIDKVSAGQRLDLNLEKGRIRDELANHNAETSNLNNKLDREINAVRAHIETTKFDLIKYCIGTLLSVLAVGLALLRYNQGK